jgi:hypothetical protein
LFQGVDDGLFFLGRFDLVRVRDHPGRVISISVSRRVRPVRPACPRSAQTRSLLVFAFGDSWAPGPVLLFRLHSDLNT